jgi:2-hydroxy-3-oxopropionate reductase
VTSQEAERSSIAFIGTGLMGAPMAARLLSSGHRVRVWNRNADKARPLLSQGAVLADSPAAAVSEADIVITMLTNGPAVSEVLFDRGVASALKPGAILIDMSSIPPALARAHSKALATRAVHHLDAPVSGGTRGAGEGTLAIMVGGSPEVFESARTVLAAMGRPTLVGPTGCGQLSKLANQVIVAVTIGAVAEALTLAAAAGADPARIREALSGGLADSMILELHGQRMLDRAWVPGGLMTTQVKDLRTILSVAHELRLELPLCGHVAELFESAVEAGFGNCDHSALLLEIERRNPGVRVGRRSEQRPE